MSTKKPELQVTQWTEQEVTAPMSAELLDQHILMMNDISKHLMNAEIAKKQASDLVKEIEAEREGVISKIGSKKCPQKLPVCTIYDWKNNIKKRVCKLENNEISELATNSIEDSEYNTSMFEKLEDGSAYAAIMRG